MTTLISIVILAFGITAFARGSATPNQTRSENPRVTTGDTTGNVGTGSNSSADMNTSDTQNQNTQNQKKKGQRARGTDQNKGSSQSY